MKYRYREECKVCGKFVLLLPHLKYKHKISSRSAYEELLRGKGDGTPQNGPSSSNVVEKYEMQYSGRGAAGLQQLLCKLEKGRSDDKNAESTRLSASARASSSHCDEATAPMEVASGIECQELEVDQPDQEHSWSPLRYYVHQLNYHKILYINIKVKEAVSRGETFETLAQRLASNKIVGIPSPKDCLKVIQLREELNRYFCFPSMLYPHPRKGLKCFDNPGKPHPKSFYLYCRKPCVDGYDCQVCKRWGRGYHVCWDFMTCAVCEERKK